MPGAVDMDPLTNGFSREIIRTWRYPRSFLGLLLAGFTLVALAARRRARVFGLEHRAPRRAKPQRGLQRFAGGARQPLARQPHRLHRAPRPADGGAERHRARGRLCAGAPQLQAGRGRVDALAARGAAARSAQENHRAGARSLRQPGMLPWRKRRCARASGGSPRSSPKTRRKCSPSATWSPTARCCDCATTLKRCSASSSCW